MVWLLVISGAKVADTLQLIPCDDEAIRSALNFKWSTNDYKYLPEQVGEAILRQGEKIK